jgi:hypothetical protein
MRDSIERLVVAAAEGRDRDVSDLLRLGTPVDGRATGCSGRTALDMALSGQHVECVRILLAAGANPEQRIGRWGQTTPLWHAVFHGRSDLVRTLLEAGADADGLVDRKTPAPLALAAEKNARDIAALLLRYGAVTRNLGQLRSVLACVAGAGRPAILELLPYATHEPGELVSARRYTKERAASWEEGSERRRDYIEVLRMLGDENPADMPPVRSPPRPGSGEDGAGVIGRRFPSGHAALGDASAETGRA